MNAIKHIRVKVFKVRQDEFARLAGVTQATVSRWERGTPPSLEELSRIREAASERRLLLRDKWFFEPPLASEASAA